MKPARMTKLKATPQILVSISRSKKISNWKFYLFWKISYMRIDHNTTRRWNQQGQQNWKQHLKYWWVSLEQKNTSLEISLILKKKYTLINHNTTHRWIGKISNVSLYLFGGIVVLICEYCYHFGGKKPRTYGLPITKFASTLCLKLT
jgi:hypothetical protein